MKTNGEVMPTRKSLEDVYQISILFGIFSDNGLMSLRNECTVEAFALMYLRDKVKKSGFSWNESGRLAYLKDWQEFENENAEEGGEITDLEIIADTVAENLVYSNVHFINMKTRNQVSGEIAAAISEVIKTKLITATK